MVTIGDVTIEMLRKHHKLLEQERHIAGTDWQENDLIFPSTIGTPRDAQNMYKKYKTFLKLAGLPDIGFHVLRHTVATLMLKEGVHPKVVQEHLGPADITLPLIN